MSTCAPGYYWNGKKCVKIPETLYVDPNDPAGRARYNAYQDSLALYDKYIDYRNMGLNTNAATKAQIARRYSIFPASSNAASFNLGVMNPSQQIAFNTNNINPQILPIAGWAASDESVARTQPEILAEYKKPTQPVKYKPNPEIVAKQQQLIDAGYKIGKADGIWGDKSQKAWEEFQNKTNEEIKNTETKPELELEKLPLLPPTLINTPKQQLQGEYQEDLPPQYQMPGYKVERPGFYMASPHSGQLIPHQRLIPTTVTKPTVVSKALQKFTGYNPEYSEGYVGEDGYVPGEFENAETQNRRINFQGASSLKDLKAQKEYNKAYDEYEAKEKYKQMMGNALTVNFKKYGGSLAPNIPTYYQSQGTPIYRDTTALPFDKGGDLDGGEPVPVKPQLPKGVNEVTAFIYKTVIDNINKAKAAGKIPQGADLNALGITAQILFESGNGSSALSSKYNNFGGIKADSNWKGETVELNGTKWRKYTTPEEGLQAQVDFYINNPRYKENGVFEAKTPEEHLKAVAKAGYAGNESNYVTKTMEMVNSIPNRLKKVKVDLVPETTPKEQPKEQPIELPTMFQGLGLKPTFNNNHGVATGMLNSLDYRDTQKETKKEQQVAQQQQEILNSPISMKASEGWFGSGKSLFMNQKQYGGFINSFANGGPMQQLTEFNEGGTHEQNPLGGIPQGIGANGQPNLVEQGETKLNSKDYIFSDSLVLDKDVVTALNLSKSLVGKTFAEVSKKMNKPNSRRENDTIEAKAISKDLDKLMEAQELFKQIEIEKKLAEIQSLDPNALGSLMGQGQAPIQQPMEQPIDPQMIPQESVEQLPQEFNFGGWLNDNKQGVVGGLQAAAGIGAMFIPGAQGLGTNLMMNGAKGIMGEVMQDNQPTLNTQGAYNAIPQQQGINFKYGGNMYEGGGPMFPQQESYYSQFPTPYIGETPLIENTPITSTEPQIDLTPDDDDYYNVTETPDNLMTNPGQLFSGNYQPKIQRVDETLKDKNVELDITQKPWEMALQGLPAVYNLGRGMFEKAQQLSLADYMQKPISAPKMNVDPQLAATREAYAGATAGLKNNMPGLGAYLSNRSSLANAEGQSKRDIYAGKENADNQLQLQTDVQNAQLLAQNLNNKMAVEQFNAQAKEAKKQLVGAGLVQGAQMGRASFDTQLQKQMLKLVAPDFTERWLELRGQKTK